MKPLVFSCLDFWSICLKKQYDKRLAPGNAFHLYVCIERMLYFLYSNDGEAVMPFAQCQAVV